MRALFHRTVLASAAVIASLAVAPHATHAAMALCEPSLAGAAIEDRTELQAKRLALEAWDRQLTCTRTEAGRHRCQAVAHPCTIKQVPPTEFIPLRRGASS